MLLRIADTSTIRYKNNNNNRLVLALLLTLTGIGQTTQIAQAETKLLPPGDYIYLGDKTREWVPKTFSVDTNGDITWKIQEEKPVSKESEPTLRSENQTSESQSPTKSHRLFGLPNFSAKKVSHAGLKKGQTANSALRSIKSNNPQPPISGQFDSYNFPTIEWKPKPVGGTGDGIAQLSTTMETRPSGYGWGFFTEVKVRLRLLRCSNANTSRGWTITLLDKNGFRLADIRVFQLHQIAGTEILEGQASEHGLTESDYRKAVDYSVNPN